MLLEDLEKIIKPSPEPKYIDGYVETNLLKEQIINLQNRVQIEDQQKEIIKLRKTIDNLRKKNLQEKRELIKKNVESLVHCEGLSDYVINSLVDYILEREVDNK